MQTGGRPICIFPPPAGRTIRRSWIQATALCLAVVMSVLGSISRDAMSAIISSMPAQGAPTVQGEGPPKILAEEGEEPDTPRNQSRRYWMRGIVLLIIIVLIIWLIYRSLKGWRPLISWVAGESMPPRGR
jgi:hypothetical protein